jgi:argininosuccinate lyase
MHNTPFTDMNDSEGEVQQAGFAAFDSGARVLDLFTAFLPACTIDEARVRARIDASCVTITELADTLVRDEALSFRQAHEIAARTAKAVIEAGQPLPQGHAAFAAAFREATGRPPSLDQAGFERAVSPQTFITLRDRPGGPAPAALDAAFSAYQDEIEGLAAGLGERTARIAAAEAALCAAFSTLEA